MPQTVPKRPMKGAALATVARKAREALSLLISCPRLSVGGAEADPFSENNGPAAQGHEQEQPHDKLYGESGSCYEGQEIVVHINDSISVRMRIRRTENRLGLTHGFPAESRLSRGRPSLRYGRSKAAGTQSSPGGTINAARPGCNENFPRPPQKNARLISARQKDVFLRESARY